jgi:hypothetical protein
MQKRLQTSLVVVLISTYLLSAQEPTERVRSFYNSRISHTQTFNGRHIARLQPWLSVRLRSQLLAELRQQNAYLKKFPNDKPFFGDGLSFWPREEACEVGTRRLMRQFNVVNSSVGRNSSTVDVRFSYPKECNEPAVRYKLSLVREAGRWVVNDLVYAPGQSLYRDLRKHRYSER